MALGVSARVTGMSSESRSAERRRPEVPPLRVACRASPLVELLAGEREEPARRRLAHPHLRLQARLARRRGSAISVPSAEAVSTCHG